MLSENKSQQEAKKQEAQKQQLEAILALSLLRWLNTIKKNDAQISNTEFEAKLRVILNKNYNDIIAKVQPQTLRQLDHVIENEISQNTLDVLLRTGAESQAIIRASFIADTIQKFRDTLTFEKFKGRARTHLRGVVANTEVQPVFENTKHETATFIARATAFKKANTKTWLTILDGRERAAHGNANLQSVNITSNFLVGGENLRFPGDPAGSLPNIINCRCSMIFT